MKQTLPLILAMVATPAMAEGTRHLDSHEHGVGALNIAFDGNTVAMEFHAPGADIVGFEHPAESAEDHAAIDKAVAMLAHPLELFVLPAAAECRVSQTNAELEGEHMHEEHDEHSAHDDHNELTTKDDHAEEHEDVDDHDHDDHDHSPSHTEFHATYTLNCANPMALNRIEFPYFSTFENTRKVAVQVISPTGAKAFGVERNEPVLNLPGLF